MHRDEVKAFRGSAEQHLQLLAGLGGPQAVRDLLDQPVEVHTANADPNLLDYYPFRDPSSWSLADQLTTRLRSLWDAFRCLLPALILWLVAAPSLIEISPFLAFTVGVAIVLLAAFFVWRAVGTEDAEP